MRAHYKTPHPSTDKAEVHNVVIRLQEKSEMERSLHLYKNVVGLTCLAVALVGHCECGTNHFDLRQQQDQAQE